LILARGTRSPTRPERRIGGVERILGLRDRYRVDVSGDPERGIDRRLVLALAVGMDALQTR
jgi:hypothetical protein